MVTPLEILENNKKKAFEHAKIISQEPYKFHSKKEIEKDMFAALDEGDFTSAILQLSILKDLRSNINTYISEDLGYGTKSLVRDAREAIDTVVIAPESYEMMCANHARAAITALANANEQGEISASIFEAKKKEIQDDAILFIKNTHIIFADKEDELHIKLQNSRSDENSLISRLENKVIEFNTQLVKSLEDAGITSTKKKIQVIKDFENFNDEHYHISTISKISKATIIETEAMNLGLTLEQKKMFENVLHANVGVDKMKADGPNMEWFNNQPGWKQQLIFQHAPDILSEKKTIPTQLRKELPLMRNAYTKSTYVQKNSSSDFKEVLEISHSGTLSTNIPMTRLERLKSWFKGTKKSVSAQLANITTQQIKMFSNNGEVHLSMQTSPNNPFDDVDTADRKFIQNTNSTFKTITAFNSISRRLLGGGRDLTGANNILHLLSEHLKDSEYSKVGEYLKGKISYNKIGEINKTSELGIALTYLIEAKKSMNEAGLLRLRDTENINSQISEKMAIALYSLARAKPEWGIPITNISCASGKDRSQMIVIGATSRAIAAELNLTPKAVSSVLAKTSSAQFLSGFNGGGTIGCYGQKAQTSRSSNMEIFADSYKDFGQRTADMNKFNTIDNGFVKKIVKTIFHPIFALNKILSGDKKKIDLFEGINHYSGSSINNSKVLSNLDINISEQAKDVGKSLIEKKLLAKGNSKPVKQNIYMNNKSKSSIILQ